MAGLERKDAVFAAAGNRAAAALLDFLLLAVTTAYLAEHGFPRGPGFLALAFAYFAALPLTPLQGTLGKWLCRIKPCDRAGRRLGPRASALRAGAMAGWLTLGLFVLTEQTGAVLFALTALFAAPFATMAFLPRRESLFDKLAGSLVVRWKAAPEAIAAAQPVRKTGVLNVGGAVLVCVLAGVFAQVNESTMRERDRRTRIAYALNETRELRQKVETFHARERRWPTAQALGVPQWTPYPAGGGYRLGAEGSIVISFARIPDLKGRSLTLRPSSADGKRLRWHCRADDALKPSYLLVACRPGSGKALNEL